MLDGRGWKGLRNQFRYTKGSSWSTPEDTPIWSSQFRLDAATAGRGCDAGWPEPRGEALNRRGSDLERSPTELTTSKRTLDGVPTICVARTADG